MECTYLTEFSKDFFECNEIYKQDFTKIIQKLAFANEEGDVYALEKAYDLAYERMFQQHEWLCNRSVALCSLVKEEIPIDELHDAVHLHRVIDNQKEHKACCLDVIPKRKYEHAKKLREILEGEY